MAPIKTFTVNLANKSHTKAILTPSESSTPVYELQLSWFTKEFFSSTQKPSMILRSTNSISPTACHRESGSTGPIIGSCIFPFISLADPIHICFGDPETKFAIWETLLCRKIFTSNVFELNIDLGGSIGKRTFDWKRTHEVGGLGAFKREFDFFHLKMVDRETGRIVARFNHHLWYGKKRGDLEIEEFDGGDRWELVVVLSGMAVLEYSRKIAGFSF
ncbi:uncharacterized protein RAG0_10933 [Rhynchosporium agropyri]|uniref:Uncharacterized protein n=1 Tax=Rhynchosporium agropyri TaxID=914238 RepID=A0A1E1L1X7_9HELO|nr:uncharacterized protein RAG0_10933 [Rhynchosporium agropyri]